MLHERKQAAPLQPEMHGGTAVKLPSGFYNPAKRRYKYSIKKLRRPLDDLEDCGCMVTIVRFLIWGSRNVDK